MTVLVGVKTFRSKKPGPQTVIKLNTKHAKQGKLPNRCVHAVGGVTGATLTAARRNQARLEHNKEVWKTNHPGTCCHHVRNWRSLLSA